jgi:tRNA modification GTPase
MPVEVYAIDLTDAWRKLGEILGETYEDDLLNELFSKFCLGK